MDERVLDKLKILAESAKYDVSCASSGTSVLTKKDRSGAQKGGVYVIVSQKTDAVSLY